MNTDPVAFARQSGDGGDQHAPAAVGPSGRNLGMGWRKSSHSDGTNTGCVQVAHTPGGAVLLGDSRTPEGAVIRVTVPAWRAFLHAVRSGEME